MARSSADGLVLSPDLEPVVALERAIRESLDQHNATACPFVWTKSAEELLASIARFEQWALAAHNG